MVSKGHGKTIDSYVETAFPVECKGRDEKGREILDEAVKVNVRIYKSPGRSDISSILECPYNTGAHGQRCKASHPETDKKGEGVACPYSFDIPYAFDLYSKMRAENIRLKKELSEL